MDFVKRPTSNETDEDLLRLQAEFSAEKTPSTKIFRPRQKPPFKKQEQNKLEEKIPKKTLIPPTEKIYGRFNIDLESTDGKVEQILSTVEERFPGFFDYPEKCAPFVFEECNQFAIEDGFPNVLDLSDYYKSEKEEDKPKLKAMEGKSIFSTEFLRRNKKIEDFQMEKNEKEKEFVEVESSILSEENMKKLSRMSEDEIKKAQHEIFERFDAKTIEFLRSRTKSKEVTKKAGPKVSLFKARRMVEKDSVKKSGQPIELNPELPSTSILAEEIVKNLEVIDPDKFANIEEFDPYTRLAMDPMQLDITNKCLKNIGPRQQQNLLKLFDNLKIQPSVEKNDLIEICRKNIDEIKKLYLEDFQVEENRREVHFADDVNPLADGAWFLVPIRRVLDAVQLRRSKVTEDDIEIVRLALMWTMLLMYERQTMFFTLSQPIDVYIRVAEVFLIGPDVFKDDVISQCLSKIISEYLLKKGMQHLLKFRLDKPIAGLDSFMPFYEDLVKHFEEFSYGDENFSHTLLIGAYMNSYVDDSLLSISAFWAPTKNVVRQMTISTEKSKDLLEYINEWRASYIDQVEEVFYERFSQVLAMYAAAIRDEKVTRERNPTMFRIASKELGEFVKRHTTDSDKHPEKSHQLAIMVEIIRRTVADKISL